MSVIARRYQVSEVTLSRGRDGFLEGGKAGIGGGGGGDGGEGRQEMARLRRELDEQKQIVSELTIANWVLEKTAARSP
jgi:transposase-like protein